MVLRRGLLVVGFSVAALVLSGCETKDTTKPPESPTTETTPPAASTPPVTDSTPAENSSDFEILSTDKQKKTITFRDKQTGKTETLPMEAFYKRVSEREEARAKNTPPTPPPGVKQAKPEDLPSWVVLYTGAEVTNNLQTGQQNSQFAGRVMMATGDSPDTVADFYEKFLKENDFQVCARSLVRHGLSAHAVTPARSSWFLPSQIRL